MTFEIDSLDQLREVIKPPAKAVTLKIIDHLEPHSIRFAQSASLAAFHWRSAMGEVGFQLRTGDHPLVTALDDKRLALTTDSPRTMLGGRFAMILLIAGIQETLRINGRVGGRFSEKEQRKVVLHVEELFFQCPKAFMRSQFWQPETWGHASITCGDKATTTLDAAEKKFVESAPFAFLATANGDSFCDVSPRGDPVGHFVQVLSERKLFLPDRTGNRLVDSAQNMLENSQLQLLFVIPGNNHGLLISGDGVLTTDPELLETAMVKDKSPKLGTVINVTSVQPLPNALSGVWDPGTFVDRRTFPSVSQMVLDQVRPGGGVVNRALGKVLGTITRIHNKRNLH